MPFVLTPPSQNLSPGLWGIEGKHSWNGAIVLGDKSGWPDEPYVKLKRITGLSSLGDPEDVRDLKVNAPGEVPRNSNRRGKTVAYEGLLRARSRDVLRSMEATMRAAFAEQAEGQMTVSPPDFAMPDGDSYLYRARALAFDSPDEETSPFGEALGHERPFALSLRWSDPRYYSAEEQQAVDSSGPAILATAEVGGNAPTDPVITMRLRDDDAADGSLSGVPGFYISRTAGPGEDAQPLLYVPGQFAVVGAYVIIDFALRRIYVKSGTTETELPIAAVSNWWDAGVPGLLPDTSQQVGIGYIFGTPGANQPYLDDLTVTWRDAWW